MVQKSNIDTKAAEPEHSVRRLNLRMITIVAVILVVEAAAILFLVDLTGGPNEVLADDSPLAMLDLAEERIVEVQVLGARLPNAKVGVTYLYDTEVYVQVRKKHQSRVTDHLDQFGNEIKSEISAIWKAADPSHFQEVRLETLTRKLRVLLNQHFGIDPETGEPFVEKCVIVMGTGFRL